MSGMQRKEVLLKFDEMEEKLQEVVSMFEKLQMETEAQTDRYLQFSFKASMNSAIGTLQELADQVKSVE